MFIKNVYTFTKYIVRQWHTLYNSKAGFIVILFYTCIHNVTGIITYKLLVTYTY